MGVEAERSRCADPFGGAGSSATQSRQQSVDPASVLAPFVRQRTVPLTTYRRDGTPVGTPAIVAAAPAADR